MRSVLRWVFGVACAIALGLPGHAAEAVITVAAASDLRFAMDEISAAFQKSHAGSKIQLTYGSSGNFYSQLSQQAPFDIFFSADLAYPAKLIEAGLGVADSKFSYAVGSIVIWASTNSSVDPSKLGLESLKQTAVRRIAIANPEHAPYGKAAVTALQKLGIYAAVKDRLVFGENISQAAQFVESGSADLGILAHSLAVSSAMKNKGRYWEFPRDSYPRLEQGGVILRWAKNPALTREFRDFVLSEAGKMILKRYGFTLSSE